MMRVHFEYTRGMIMMKNKSTFSMGRALILRTYSRHLQNPAAVIILHFNKLVHHIGGLLLLAFCSEKGAAIESAGKAPQITSSERHTTESVLRSF